MRKAFSNAPLDLVENIPLSNVQPRDLVANVNVHHINDEFFFLEVTPEMVHNAMISLSRKRGRDIYGLNLEILLCVSDSIAPVFASLINLCFVEKMFPPSLKVSLIYPVFKKGDTNIASNYRPISILPILSKVVERIMADQIMLYVTHFNILTPSQFGFRRNLSTTDAVSFFNRFISASFDRKSYIHATLCDLSRAFECLNHNILLTKLRHYKFHPSSIELIKSYLRDRSYIVKVGEKLSDPCTVNLGIPTGSILGPLTFLLYINDLPANLPSYAKATIFADDTTLFVEDNNEQELLEKASITLAKAQVWFLSNRLLLNQDKTQEIIFSLKNISMLDNPPYVKLLGLHLDPHMKWQDHVDVISTKISSRIFLLAKLQNQVSPPILKNAYYGLVHSILSYGILLWGHTTAANDLFILQKRAVRILGSAKYLDHARPHFIKLGILTVPSMFILQCLLYLKKNSTQYENFENVHNYNTRNKKNLVPIFHRINSARNGINYHGVLFFNKLCPSTRELPYPAFKLKVENILRNNAYYSISEFLSFDLRADMT